MQRLNFIYAAGMQQFFHRLPWPADFPVVIVHGDVRMRNAHPSYAAAKSGDALVAVALVRDMLLPDDFELLNAFLGGWKPLVVPVTAIEVSGYYAIPDAMAQLIGARLGLTVQARRAQTVQQGCTYQI